MKRPFSNDKPLNDKDLFCIKISHLNIQVDERILRDELFQEFQRVPGFYGIHMSLTDGQRYAVVAFKSKTTVDFVLVRNGKLFLGQPLNISKYNDEIDFLRFETFSIKKIRQHFKDIEEDCSLPTSMFTRVCFVGNLDSSIKTQELQTIFEKFGDIVNITIKKKHQHTSNFAFINYIDVESTIRAHQAMNGKSISNSVIKVGYGRTTPSNSIHLSRLPNKIEESYLKSNIEVFGIITCIIMDSYLNQAIIVFAYEDSAIVSYKELKEKEIFGCNLLVDYCSKESKEAFITRLNIRQSKIIPCPESNLIPTFEKGTNKSNETAMNNGDITNDEYHLISADTTSNIKYNQIDISSKSIEDNISSNSSMSLNSSTISAVLSPDSSIQTNQTNPNVLLDPRIISNSEFYKTVSLPELNITLSKKRSNFSESPIFDSTTKDPVNIQLNNDSKAYKKNEEPVIVINADNTDVLVNLSETRYIEKINHENSNNKIDAMDSRISFSKYPIIWNGNLNLKTHSVSVDFHFLSGNSSLLSNATSKSFSINQRMQMNLFQIDILLKHMTENNYCLCIAISNNILTRANYCAISDDRCIIKNAFSEYLNQKQSAGVVNISPKANDVVTIMHIFTVGEFFKEQIKIHASDLMLDKNFECNQMENCLLILVLRQ